MSCLATLLDNEILGGILRFLPSCGVAQPLAKFISGYPATQALASVYFTTFVLCANEINRSGCGSLRWNLTETNSTPWLDPDANLHFGVLALQSGLLDPAQFADACSAWATRKETSLADLLVQRQWLTEDDRLDLNRMLERKLERQARRQTEHPAAPAPATSPAPSTRVPAAADDTMVLAMAELAPVTGTQFVQKRLHAAGGMGQIWQAHELNLDRDVAIKTLRAEYLDSPQSRERFLQEARIMGQLSHAGIPPVHVLGQDDGSPYYVMKFISGRTLFEAIAEYHEQTDPLVLRDLLRHFGRVCQTIAFAHSRGVLHRDLKPANIMLGSFGETFVVDWGLAKQLTPGLTPSASDSGLTQMGQLLGTPAYIPPEQLTGSPASAATDIYALGAMLYEILSGRPPFIGNSVLDIVMQSSQGKICPPSQIRGDSVPPGLEAIALKAMSFRPENRHASAAELAHVVEDWLAEELVRSEAALRESEARFRALLESTAEGIYWADMDGKCVFCNPACARMLGYDDPAALLGLHMHNLMHHHRPDGSEYPVEQCRIYQAFRDGLGTHVVDEVYWRADGTPFPVEYWSYPVLRDGQLVGCVVSFMDITKRIKREQELIRAGQLAEEACAAARVELETLQGRLGGSIEAPTFPA